MLEAGLAQGHYQTKLISHIGHGLEVPSEKYKLVTYDCQQIFPNIQVQGH